MEWVEGPGTGNSSRRGPSPLSRKTEPQIAEWLRPDDPASPWEGTGRSGGVWDPSASSRFNAKGPDTSNVRRIHPAGSGDFFWEEVGEAAIAQASTSPQDFRLTSSRFNAISSVRGNSYPRIASRSLPYLDYSWGNAAVNWAREVLDIELLPWQQFLLREGCARLNGRFRYRTLLTVVARQNGKTLLATVRILAGLVLFGERFVLGTAQNRSTSMESWHQAFDLASDAGLLVTERRLVNGQEQFRVNGGRYRVVTSSVSAARGLSGVDLIVMDEIRQMSGWEAYGAIDKTRRARRDSQVWTITTEGDQSSVVLNKLQEQARLSIEDNEATPLGYWEWSASPNSHAGRPETWADANPALGWTLDEDVVQAEYKTDPPEIFEVEVLCRKVATLQGWVSAEAWGYCASDQQFPVEEPYIFALDAGPELRQVSIVAGALKDEQHHLELIAQLTGPHCLDAAEARLDSLLRRWKPRALAVLAKSPVEALALNVGSRHDVEIHIVRPAEFARACRAFYAAATQRKIRHPGGPGIAQGLASCKRGADGLVSSVHKVNPHADIDAALAAILALWVPTQLPEPEPVPQWTVF